LEGSKKDLQEQVDQLTPKVDALAGQESAIQGVLAVYNQLKNLGYDEKTLTELKKASDTYGGAGGVLEAMNSYACLQAIQSSISEFEAKKASAESD